MDKQIDCPTCGRMGRVTVILPNGTLSTARCADCNGEGMRFECNDPACHYCVSASAKAQPARPLFAWTNADVYA
ncbi:DnaJ-like chaperonin [Microbacterium phage LeeroyJenkins]|nr:DnaJ-like chaperonin [Microbacterium phage LeeroyJenkins]QDK01522.1 DnaJ-like chaperonin [Microbacterium phage LeeroyJenkins]